MKKAKNEFRLSKCGRGINWHSGHSACRVDEKRQKQTVRLPIFLLAGIIIFVLTFSCSYILITHAWTEPTASPPNDNVSPPINIGPYPQYKAGRIAIGTSSTKSNWLYISDYGQTGEADIRIEGTGSGNAANLYLKGTGGTTSQIYQPAGSGDLRFWTGGGTPGDRITIRADGNIGIGTVGPLHRLEVQGSASIGNFNVNVQDFRLQRQGSAHKVVRHWYTSSAESPWYTYGENLIWTGERSGTVLDTTAARPYYEAYSPFTGHKEFGFVNVTTGTFTNTNLVPNLVLTNTSNVGIGTTGPSQKLSVVGDIGLSGANRFIGATDNFALSLRTNNADRIYITNTGNVGIGTTGPQTKIDIFDSTTGPLLSMRGLDTNYRGMKIADTANSEKWFVGNNASNNFVIRNANTTDYLTVLNSSGNVGIGTTGPGGRLDVRVPSGTTALAAQILNLQNAANAHGLYINTTRTSSDAYTLNVCSGGASRLYVRSDGNIGISTTGPAFKFQIYKDGTGGVFAVDENGNTGINMDPDTTGHHKFQVQQKSLNVGAAAVVGIGSDCIPCYPIQQPADQRIGVLGLGVGVGVQGISNLGSGVIGMTTMGPALYAVQNGVPSANNAAATLRVSRLYTSLGGYTVTTPVIHGDDTSTATGPLLRLDKQGTTRFIVTSTGNVGIGITNPIYGIDVRGSSVSGQINAEAGLCINGDCRTSWSEVSGFWSQNGNHIYNTNSGNVGIGVNNPISTLTVQRNAVNLLTLNRNPATVNELYMDIRLADAIKAYVGYGDSGRILTGTGAGYKIRAVDNFYLGTNDDSVKMTVLTNGNVGIGTTGPQTKIDVFDSTTGPLLSMRGLDTNYRGMKIADTANSEKWFVGNNASNNFVIRNAGATDYITVLNNGNVGIGMTAPITTLNVRGGRELFPIGGGGNAYGSIHIQMPSGVPGNSRPTITAGTGSDFLITFGGGYEGLYGTTFEVRTDISEAGSAGTGSSNLDQALVVKRTSQDGTTANVLSTIGVTRLYPLTTAGIQLAPGPKGTPSLIVTTAGNVGIGTTGPQTKIDVFDSTTGPLLSIRGLDTNYRGMKIADTANSEKWFVGNNASNNFVIRNANTTDYLTVLNSSGNVGIGVTNPGAKLDLRGGLASFNVADEADNFRTAAIVPVNSPYGPPNPDQVNREMRFIQYKDGGMYGVGIAFGMAPYSLSQWYAGSWSTAQFFLFYNGYGLTIRGSNQNPGGTPTLFTPSDLVTFKGSGEVGIGINPTAKLELANNSWIMLNAQDTGEIDAAGINFYETGSKSATAVQYGASIRYNENDDRLEIVTRENNSDRYGIVIPRSTGNVGIGTTTPGSRLAVYQLATGGSANMVYNAASGVITYVASSKRFKNNIQPLQDNFSKILLVQPKTFTWKSSGQRDIGYIAEDFEDLGLTNLVIYDAKGQVESIKYDKIPLYLLEVVKKQQKEIEELKKEIDRINKTYRTDRTDSSTSLGANRTDDFKGSDHGQSLTIQKIFDWIKRLLAIFTGTVHAQTK